MTRSKFTLLVLLGATLTASTARDLRAQLIDVRRGATTSSNAPGAVTCTNSSSAPTLQTLAPVTCATSGSGATATGTAELKAGPGGYISSAASATVTDGYTAEVTAAAAYNDYVTISGPLTQIFRAAVRSVALADASSASHGFAAYVNLFAYSYDPTLGQSGASSNVFSLTQGVGLQGSPRILEVFVSAAVIQASHQLFFGMQADSKVSADAQFPSYYATARATLPTIAFYDVNGADITDQFTLDYASMPVTSTPEPASMLLVGSGLSGLALKFRRRKTAAA